MKTRDSAINSSISHSRQGGEPQTSELALRMGYLLSRYPAISHTFFQAEVEGLRGLGFDIETASINEPDMVSAAASPDAVLSTYFVKKTKRSRIASIFLRSFFRGTTWRALRLALQVSHTRPYALYYLAEAVLVSEWMKRQGLNHLHVHFGGPVATVGMLAAQVSGKPYTLTLHGPDEFFDVEHFALREKCMRASSVLCISEYGRSQVLRLLPPEQWHRVHVAYLGVDTERFAPVHRTPQAGLRVVCVGRLVAAKAQALLMEAFAEATQDNASFELHLVGDGPDRTSLACIATRLGIAERVVFHGALNHAETRAVLASATIFALPSFAEGIPVALMEAMAFEIPVISTYIAGIPELIRDGLDGMLVPASSVPALRDALERLLVDQNLRESLGHAGRRRVLEHFNIDTNLEILANTFRGLITAGPGVSQR